MLLDHTLLAHLKLWPLLKGLVPGLTSSVHLSMLSIHVICKFQPRSELWSRLYYMYGEEKETVDSGKDISSDELLTGD